MGTGEKGFKRSMDSPSQLALLVSAVLSGIREPGVFGKGTWAWRTGPGDKEFCLCNHYPDDRMGEECQSFIPYGIFCDNAADLCQDQELADNPYYDCFLFVSGLFQRSDLPAAYLALYLTLLCANLLYMGFRPASKKIPWVCQVSCNCSTFY